MHRLYERLFKTKDGDYVLGQPPNWPIIATMALGVAWVVSVGILHGHGARWLRDVGLGCFIYWALLELVWGVNLFRRLLGAGAILLCASLIALAAHQ